MMLSLTACLLFDSASNALIKSNNKILSIPGHGYILWHSDDFVYV